MVRDSRFMVPGSWCMAHVLMCRKPREYVDIAVRLVSNETGATEIARTFVCAFSGGSSGFVFMVLLGILLRPDFLDLGHQRSRKT